MTHAPQLFSCQISQMGEKDLSRSGVINLQPTGQMQSVEPLDLACGAPHGAGSLAPGEQWLLMHSLSPFKIPNPKPSTACHSQAIPLPPHLDWGQAMPPPPLWVGLEPSHAPSPLQGWVEWLSFPGALLHVGGWCSPYQPQFWIGTTGGIQPVDGQGSSYLAHWGNRFSTPDLIYIFSLFHNTVSLA